MFATSPCGIGGPTNPDGPCTGTLGQQASSGLGQILQGVSGMSIVAALLAAAAILAGIFFVRWGATKVAAYFDAREAEARRLQNAADAEERAAKRLADDYRRNTDFADLGQKLHEAGGFDDDAEDDFEDDVERDDALEYDSERRA